MSRPEDVPDLPALPIADRIHVVLVEPGDPLNIGAVARAMSNLGFHHLHLVAPHNFDRTKADISACWGVGLLDTAQVHPDLETALSTMDQVVGFSGRHGADRPRHLLLPDWGARVHADPPARLALLFGPEDHGLETHHLAHCRWLVRIPSAAANPSFNLSQSVLLALFELSRDAAAAMVPESRPRPPMAEFSQLDRLVAASLKQSGYFGKGTPRPVPRMVKTLFRRADPDTREMGILMGMFGKIHRALAGTVPTYPVALEDIPDDALGGSSEGSESSAGRPQ